MKPISVFYLLRRSAGIALVSLAAAAALLAFTRTGLGVRGDSVRYMMGARNLLAGNGFSRLSGGGEIFPETGFAPLLAYQLAGLALVGEDLLEGSRLLHTLFLAASVALSGALVLRYTGSKTAAVLACLLLATSPLVLEWHGWLMAEPLFILLTLAGLTLLVSFLDGGRGAQLVAGGVLAGLSGLARYVGVALAPAAAVGVWMMGKGDLRARLGHVLLVSALAIGPLGLWMARNQAVGAQGFANRQILLHAMRPEVLRHYLFEAASWFVPETIAVPRGLRASIAVALAGAAPLAFLWRRGRQWLRRIADGRPAASLPWLCLAYVPAYVSVLIVNSLLLDAGTTISAVPRYLAPLYFVVVILLGTTYYDWLSALPRRWPARLGLALCLAISGLQGVVSARLVTASTAAQGFTRLTTRWPSLAEDLAEAAGPEPIISNNPELVYYLLDRPAYMMPILFDVYQQAEREDFEEQVALAAQRMKDASVLVLFGPPKPDEAEALRRLPIRRLLTLPETVLYVHEDSARVRP